ncbi:ATP-binding protein [Microbacterium sp. NPDC056736]|uniref:ATP-binding protein n=1 Tax=Microbacterium sp. NPDC056736 TaxID=3345932 RepID=UPI00366B32A4
MLKPSLEQAFAQVHDYRRLTTLVIQNINVLLEQSHPGLDLEEQLRRSERPVRSMYWAARLMEFKLESALFMVHPERIDDPVRRRAFRFHGLVRKYVGIYEAQMATRGITYREQGQSFGQLNENPDAVGVIPNAYIDNAIKYAPTGSEIVISFNEDASTIRFSVGSLGPRISKTDMEHLFDLFYRAPAAIETSEDGTGFGLALAQHVAERIEAKLEVTQDGHEQSKGYFWTTFSAELKKRPQEEGAASLYRARGRVPGGARPTD